MRLPYPFLLLVLPVALFATAAVWFWLTEGFRDRVLPPSEERFGAGGKKVLIIYQPSRRGAGTMLVRALANTLSRRGFEVTVNFPSAALEYNPMDFDLLIFGGTTYVGGVARPLTEYLSGLKFSGKHVLLYVVGDMDKAPELAQLRLSVPVGNLVRSIKVKVDERDRLTAFALGMAA